MLQFQTLGAVSGGKVNIIKLSALLRSEAKNWEKQKKSDGNGFFPQNQFLIKSIFFIYI